MGLAGAVDFARRRRESVLATVRRDGRPQLSNVFHQVGDDGLIRISITADRAKHRNLSRVPWAALHVTQADFLAWVVLEGDVDLSPVAARPDDPTVDELVAHYRAAVGDHEDWLAFRRSQVADHRVMARLRPSHAYGLLTPA
jgi:PPOX class probable F420-dependent enzyme